MIRINLLGTNKPKSRRAALAAPTMEIRLYLVQSRPQVSGYRCQNEGRGAEKPRT